MSVSVGMHAHGSPLYDCPPLKLCYCGYHLNGKPAHRIGGIKGLGHRTKPNFGFIKEVDNSQEVAQTPGKPIQAVENYYIELPILGVLHEPETSRSLFHGNGPRDTVVQIFIDYRHAPVGSEVAQSGNLAINCLPLPLIVGADTVDAIAPFRFILERELVQSK